MQPPHVTAHRRGASQDRMGHLVHGGDIRDDEGIDEITDGGDSVGVVRWRWGRRTGGFGREGLWVRTWRENRAVMGEGAYIFGFWNQSSLWVNASTTHGRSAELLQTCVWKCFPIKCASNAHRICFDETKMYLMQHFSMQPRIASTDVIICFNRNQQIWT